MGTQDFKYARKRRGRPAHRVKRSPPIQVAKSLTIHLRGMPNQWDEWRPSKLNLYEGDGDSTSSDSTSGDTTSGDPSGGAFDGPGAADGFGQGFGDAATTGTLGDTFGSQGQQGPDSTFGSNLGDVFGPEGTFSDPAGPNSTFGSNLGDVFGPKGPYLVILLVPPLEIT